MAKRTDPNWTKTLPSGRILKRVGARIVVVDPDQPKVEVRLMFSLLNLVRNPRRISKSQKKRKNNSRNVLANYHQKSNCQRY